MGYRLLPLAALVAVLVTAIGCAAEPAARPNASITPLPAGSTYMPDFRGQTAQTAADILRGQLGESTSVVAPGGAAASNQIVTRSVPAPGAIVNGSTSFTLYTAGSGTGSGSGAGSAAAAPAPAAGTVNQGTYVIGTDIPAGTYRTTGSQAQGQSLCQWRRLKDTTGDASAILASGTATGPTTMTIKPSDGAVEFYGGCIWTRV